MAKTPQVKPYPPHAGYSGGCKVSWYGYATEAEAFAASKIAKWNGRILENQGYDFGYQLAGEIHKPGAPGNRFEDLYCVTIP